MIWILLRRFWPVLAAGAAIGALLIWHDLQVRAARAEGRAEIRAEWAADKAARAESAVQITRAIIATHDGINRSLTARDEQIVAQGRDITIKLEREMAGETRYRSAECRLGGGVLQEINRARGLSAGSAAGLIGDDGVSGGGVAAGRRDGGAGAGGR